VLFRSFILMQLANPFTSGVAIKADGYTDALELIRIR
jgi:hypothetical protein